MKVCKGHRCLVVPIKSDAATGSIPAEPSAGGGRPAMRVFLGFCGLPFGIDPVKYAVRFGRSQNAHSALGDFVYHIPADKIASETPSRGRSLRKAAILVRRSPTADTDASSNYKPVPGT